MENNEKELHAQHSTGKHPEPSEDVQSDIETVTPDTENPGQEDVNKHESQDNEKAGSEEKEEKPGEGEATEDSSQDKQQDDTGDSADNQGGAPDGDVSDEVETVSP